MAAARERRAGRPLVALLIGAAMVTAGQGAPPQEKPARDDAAAEKLGWQLGAQAWTFRDRGAFEAIEAAHRLGLRYIELYPGQKLSADHADVKVGPGMGSAWIDALRKKLESEHVRAMSFGVVDMKNDERALRPLFEFGRELGLKNLSAEPDFDAFELVDRLAAEYQIRIALHNHPRPSRYWNPDIVLEHVQGRSKWIGSCSDTGHWTRGGLKPVDCLKKLEGRVIELHFKDLNEFGNPDAVDVPWGTGKSDARGILAELKRQEFRGLISVEYETGAGEEVERNVARCVAFFDQTARELSGPSKK
jgi:sugar phosphate isomerase/epimerase